MTMALPLNKAAEIGLKTFYSTREQSLPGMREHRCISLSHVEWVVPRHDGADDSQWHVFHAHLQPRHFTSYDFPSFQ
jgi:hypothetical protein